MKKTITLLCLLFACLCLLCACDEKTDETPVHTHAWSEWSVTTAATCGTAGTQERSCACGEKETQGIAPTSEHVWGTWAITSAADCDTAGAQERTCSTCGGKDTQVIPATGHTKQWETTALHSYKKNGKAVCTCTVCKNVLEEKIIPAGVGSNSDQLDSYNRLLDSKYDANSFYKDSLPQELDYDGEAISILHWSDCERPEFEEDCVTGDNVRDAIHERNAVIEERLNVDLVFYPLRGTAMNRQSFIENVLSVYESGLGTYDLIASYSLTEGMLAVQGLLYDISDIESSYIDLENPWWPDQIATDAAIGDSLYFLTGDMSTNALYMTRMIYFNKDLVEQYELESPYPSVYNGTWTVDKLIAWTSSLANSSLYHFTAFQHVSPSFYSGAGLRFLEKDPQRLLKVSEDYTSQKAIALINKLSAWSSNDDTIFIADSSGVYGSDTYTTNGQVMFRSFRDGETLASLQHLTFAESSYGFELGLLPVPKYDAQQSAYYCEVGVACSLYGIFAGFDDRGGEASATLTMLTAVMECWASEGYRRTSPEIFEACVHLKYGGDTDEHNMFTYIHDSMTLDLGTFYNFYVNSIESFPGIAITNGADWAEVSGGRKASVEERLVSLLESLQSQS